MTAQIAFGGVIITELFRWRTHRIMTTFRAPRFTSLGPDEGQDSWRPTSRR